MGAQWWKNATFDFSMMYCARLTRSLSRLNIWYTFFTVNRIFTLDSKSWRLVSLTIPVCQAHMTDRRLTLIKLTLCPEPSNFLRQMAGNHSRLDNILAASCSLILCPKTLRLISTRNWESFYPLKYTPFGSALDYISYTRLQEFINLIYQIKIIMNQQ